MPKFRAADWRERHEALGMVRAGELTVAEVAELFDVGENTVRGWLGPGSRREVSARERERRYLERFERILAWMVESRRFKVAPACAALGIPYGSFMMHLRTQPEWLRRIDDAEDAAKAPHVPPCEAPSTRLAEMRADLARTEGERDELATQMDDLIGDLRGPVPEE